MNRRAALACCLHYINGVAGNKTLLLLLQLLLLRLVRRVCGTVLLGAVGCCVGTAWRCALLWLAAWGLARRTALLCTWCCCCSCCYTR